MTSSRIGTVFHECFPLYRSSIAQVLSALAQFGAGEDLRRTSHLTRLLKAHTHLGNNYIKSMPRYAIGAGLLTESHDFTQFGRYVVVSDPLFEKQDTQWLMHYRLSAPHGPGPEFWNRAVTLYFRTDNEFSRSNLVEVINSNYLEVKGKSLAIDSASDTARIFKDSYVKEEGLGKLGILEEVSLHQYRVLSPVPPSPWVVGYALLDYWQAQFGDRLTVNLDALSGNGSLADLFLMGAERLDGMLRILQSEGYVDVYRVAPPYQVVLLRQDPIPLLEKIYGSYNLT